MVHNRTPCSAVLRVEVDVFFTNEVAPCVYVLQEEQIFSSDLIAWFGCLAVLRLFIAFEFPVVTAITQAIVAIAWNFLSLTEWGSHAFMRVQVFASIVVLKSNIIATFDNLARTTWFLVDLSVTHSEERRRIIVALGP